MKPVVNQNNHISNLIQEHAPSLTQTQAAPHETASQQSAQAQAFEQATPPPSAQPVATVAAPAQQTPHAESAQADPLHEHVSKKYFNAIYDRLYAFVEGVTAPVQANQPFVLGQAFRLLTEVIAAQTATDVMSRRAIYARKSVYADQGFSTPEVLCSVNVCIYTK